MERTAHTKRDEVRLVPDPTGSADDAERYRHEDLLVLTARQLWAESVLISNAIAYRTFLRQRPRLIDAVAGVTDEEWLRERLNQLRRRLSKMKRSAA